MNDVGLDGAQRFVPDHDEDLLLFLQVDEVPKPRLLSQPAGTNQESPKQKHYSGVTLTTSCKTWKTPGKSLKLCEFDSVCRPEDPQETSRE